MKSSTVLRSSGYIGLEVNCVLGHGEIIIFREIYGEIIFREIYGRFVYFLLYT